MKLNQRIGLGGLIITMGLLVLVILKGEPVGVGIVVTLYTVSCYVMFLWEVDGD